MITHIAEAVNILEKAERYKTLRFGNKEQIEAVNFINQHKGWEEAHCDMMTPLTDEQKKMCDRIVKEYGRILSIREGDPK